MNERYLPAVVGPHPDALAAAIVSATDDAVISIDPDGTITSWNQGAQHLLGYAPPEILGRPVLDLVPPGRDHELRRLLERADRGERAADLDAVRLHRDGTRVPVAVTVSSLLDVDGGPLGYCAIMRDRSARAGAAAALQDTLDELQMRQRWADAIADIQLALLGGAELADCLDLLARSVATVASADGAAVVVVNDRVHLTTVAAAGSLSDRAGADVEMDSLSGAVARSGSAVRFADLAALRTLPDVPFSAMPAGPAIGVALPASSGPLGALWLHRVDPDRPFTTLELEVAEAFGRSAGMAIGIGMARHFRHEAEELAERDHLAARLHDRVIQRLFGLGMSLEAMAGTCHDPTLVHRLRGGAEEVDTAIEELRDAIFGLTRSRPSRSARMRLAEAIVHAVPRLGFRPELEVDGLVDSTLPPPLVDDAVDVVRSIVADLAERDGVRSALVRVRVDDHLTISVDDDGPAPTATTTPSLHLAKLSARAHAVGGSSVVSTRDGGGRRLRWQVPLRG